MHIDAVFVRPTYMRKGAPNRGAPRKWGKTTGQDFFDVKILKCDMTGASTAGHITPKMCLSVA